MPPEWMWPLEHELIPWFDEVKVAREERHGNPGKAEDETVPMTENELTAHMRRR